MRHLIAATEALASLWLMLGGIASLHAQDAQAIASVESLIKADKFAEARTPLESYTAAHPQSWQALYQLGYVDFRLHRIQESLAMLCRSLVLNPTFAESHKILAYDLNILGRQDLAIHELEQAIGYDAGSAESYYELGRIYYERGSYPEAIKDLEQAKSLSPEYVRVYHNLGLAYSAVGEKAKAVTNFDMGLQLNTRQSKPSAWPLIDYATYCNLQGEFEKARDMLLEAVGIDNEWEQEFDELSKAYRGLGQKDEAIDVLKKAVALNPRKAEYHYVLARLYRQGNQVAQAKEELAQYEQQKGREARKLTNVEK
jgi:tetratricopeptide (TPR) repeat protein